MHTTTSITPDITTDPGHMGPDLQQQLASTVLAVILRVAGPVITDVRPHALATPEAQVCARIGDALFYLTDLRAAGLLRQHWDVSQYLVTRLPERVSQTWLGPDPNAYPVGVHPAARRRRHGRDQMDRRPGRDPHPGAPADPHRPARVAGLRPPGVVACHDHGTG